MMYGERPRLAAGRIFLLPQPMWREEILKYPQPELHELIRSHLKDFKARAKMKQK